MDFSYDGWHGQRSTSNTLNKGRQARTHFFDNHRIAFGHDQHHIGWLKQPLGSTMCRSCVTFIMRIGDSPLAKVSTNYVQYKGESGRGSILPLSIAMTAKDHFAASPVM
jgi:hypothetical protein